MIRSHRDQDFTEFATMHEPRLRRAFTAAYGTDRGSEATAEALAYAWQHWKHIADMTNPLGYLYRVGQSRTRPRRRHALAPEWKTDNPQLRHFEPGLAPALAAISEGQRVAVVLVHGFEWTLQEVADFTGVSISTVQTHLERGLRNLRGALEVEDSA